VGGGGKRGAGSISSCDPCRDARTEEGGTEASGRTGARAGVRGSRPGLHHRQRCRRDTGLGRHGAVPAGHRNALPGLGLSLRLAPGPQPPALTRSRPVTPQKPRAARGPALTHLTPRGQHGAQPPARARQPLGFARSADSRGAGPPAGAGRRGGGRLHRSRRD
jgi:hypothetical protein